MLLEKCETVVRRINRIKSKIPKSIEDLLIDLDAQDIIILNLERAARAKVDIAAYIISTQNLRSAESLSQSHVVLFENGILSQKTSVRMQKAVGIRNLFVHEYAEIGWSIVL